MAVCQNLVPLVNIKIAGKWMFIPLKMVLIGIDPYPFGYIWDVPECMSFRAAGQLPVKAPGLPAFALAAHGSMPEESDGVLMSPGSFCLFNRTSAYGFQC
jgi:hypothetical protein